MITKITISLLVVVVTGLALRAIWSPKIAELTPEGHNICLGPGAGRDITTESYQFCFATDPNCEYRANMSPKEYEVISAVVERAHTAGNLWKPVIGYFALKNVPTGNTRESVGLAPIK